MKKKAISIEIEKPRFVLNDSLLESRTRRQAASASAFTIKHIRIRHGELNFKGRDITMPAARFQSAIGAR